MNSQNSEPLEPLYVWVPKPYRVPCCDYAVPDGSIGPVHANPGNGCVQCHNCGAQYVLKEKQNASQ